MFNWEKRKDPEEHPPTQEEIQIMRELDRELGIVPDPPTPPKLKTMREGTIPVPYKKYEVDVHPRFGPHEPKFLGVCKMYADVFRMSHEALFTMRIIMLLGAFMLPTWFLPAYLITWFIIKFSGGGDHIKHG